MNRPAFDVLCEFARADGFAGFVRLARPDPTGAAWCWAYLVGVPGVDGLVVVRDHDVPPPRRGLEVKGEGLWADFVCEIPATHWTIGLEAYGVRLDAPQDALGPGGEIGERLPVGLDLEWEAGPGGPPAGAVHGDVLVGPLRLDLDAPGWCYEDATVVRPRFAGERVARVCIPGAGERHLVRTAGGLRWTDS